jgi:hypothetical protein
MAIFPLYNKHVVNYPANVSDNFIAGMALTLDTNGNAVKADRANILFDDVLEQTKRFIGFASGDHNQTTTIISSDPVGSNYNVDNNFFSNNNSHFSAAKRSIQDFRDENINQFYNIFNATNKSLRGVGVYNLQGEIYITDQYATKLASTFGQDSYIDIIFNPGDLLTFGAGVNAGKLVKVDTSGSGPSVIIVGVVEKLDSASKVLYFRHVLETYNNTVSISTTGLYMNLDASSNISYPGSGTVWYDLSGNNLNGSMNNGAYWSPENGGVIVLDTIDDRVTIPHNAIMDFSGDFTVEIIFYALEGFLTGILAKANTGGVPSGNSWVIGSWFGGNPIFWNPLTTPSGVFLRGKRPVYINTWYSIIFTRTAGVMTSYINGIFDDSVNNPNNYTNTHEIQITVWASWQTAGKIAAVRFYNTGFTAEQAQRNHNAIYQRLVS